MHVHIHAGINAYIIFMLYFNTVYLYCYTHRYTHLGTTCKRFRFQGPRPLALLYVPLTPAFPERSRMYPKRPEKPLK